MQSDHGHAGAAGDPLEGLGDECGWIEVDDLAVSDETKPEWARLKQLPAHEELDPRSARPIALAVMSSNPRSIGGQSGGQLQGSNEALVVNDVLPWRGVFCRLGVAWHDGLSPTTWTYPAESMRETSQDQSCHLVELSRQPALAAHPPHRPEAGPFVRL